MPSANLAAIKTLGPAGRRLGDVTMLVLAAVATALWAQPAVAVEQVEVAVADVTGAGWAASGIVITVGGLSPQSVDVSATVARLTIAGAGLTIEDLKLACPRLALTARKAECRQLAVSQRGLPLDKPGFRGAFAYNFDSRRIEFDLSELVLAGGRAALKGSLTQGGWQASLSAPGLQAGKLWRLAGAYLALPEGIEPVGTVTLVATASGAGTPQQASARIAVANITASNADGTLALENLGAELTVQGRLETGGWRTTVELERASGQTYLHPVFTDLSAHPLAGRLALGPDRNGDWLAEFEATQQGLARLSGSAGFSARDWQHPHRVEVRVRDGRLPLAYDFYLQPFLVGTVADSLETAGLVDASLTFRDGAVESLEVVLTDVHADDTRDRFAFYGINGRLDWHASLPRRSRIGWQGGYGYRIGFGATELAIASQGQSVTLEEPVRMPVLDGAVRVRQFSLARSETGNLRVAFDAELEPVGLRALTRALGWPPFAGTVSGAIPRMRYEDQQLVLEGVLAAQVFDGKVEISGLRLSNPFGVLPELSADVTLRGLDLALLTGTFSFGHMEGRLDGEVSALRMLGFAPESFTARLYTTPGDRSRHRISQQAIENISDIGGAGAAAALSRGMLRFFDAFAYDRIGWSCVLADEVCNMDGVAPAPGNGYYIVKGKGLPRIDVIGFSRRVSWPRLMDKLRDISRGQSPEIR